MGLPFFLELRFDFESLPIPSKLYSFEFHKNVVPLRLRSNSVQIPSEMISSSFQTLPEINKDQLVSVGNYKNCKNIANSN